MKYRWEEVEILSADDHRYYARELGIAGDRWLYHMVELMLRNRPKRWAFEMFKR